VTESDYFPEFESYDRAGLTAPGYALLHLSVFDHWLTNEEAGDCGYMFHGMAQETEEDLAEYQKGEDKFLAFYRALLGSNPVIVSKDEHFYLEGGEALIETIIIPSLREQRLMDIFVESANVRVLGGHDRTDVLLLREAEREPALRAMAQAAGLFVLD